MSGPWLLLSDVHLGTSPRLEREAAVGALLEQHPGVNVVFLGDLFEFGASRGSTPEAALTELLRVNGRFVEALRAHARTGGRIHWVAGNHDAALAGLEEHARRELRVDVEIWPWFLRFGNVHLEHGHLFDRDNAPLHPQAPWDIRDEPLGVALMRHVVVELGVPAWAHAHQTTPARALKQALDWFEWRLPFAATRGFGALLSLSVAAAAGRWGRVDASRAEGLSRLDSYAVRVGVTGDALQALLTGAPTPTHARWHTTFRRLYLDWLSAASTTLVGAGIGITVGGFWPWALAGVGAAYAVKEGRLRGGSRYPSPLDALHAGAHHIARTTGARRVIFGHTHVEYDDGIYTNLGSFGYPNAHGRAYGTITEDGIFTRHHLTLAEFGSTELNPGDKQPI